MKKQKLFLRGSNPGPFAFRATVITTRPRNLIEISPTLNLVMSSLASFRQADVIAYIAWDRLARDI